MGLCNICWTYGSFKCDASERQDYLLTEGHFCSLGKARFTHRVMSFITQTGGCGFSGLGHLLAAALQHASKYSADGKITETGRPFC